MKFTNEKNIPIALAVWLASDFYDRHGDPNTISATSLLRPLRSIVLERQMASMPGVEASTDLMSVLPSRMGTATHDAVEKAWSSNYKDALKMLGLNQNTIDKFLVNPEPEDIQPDSICVYIEKRGYKKIGKWTITGKFDFVVEGEVHDLKTTKTYSWIAGTNDEDYRKQGSIYRWLSPEIITQDVMTILYVFQDWTKMRAIADGGYPQNACLAKKFPLYDLESTESFIKGKLDKVEALEDKNQDELPLCSQEELWQTETTYAYYKNPQSRTRATRVFKSMHEAQSKNAQDGGRGLITPRPGEVKRCNYCNAISICKQAKDLEIQGLLKG